jgi:hypothetical protein
MRRTLVPVLLAVVASGIASRAAADDSVFGIRGLGILGRPMSGRTAATGGAFAVFDAQALLNPAALGQLEGVSGWAVGSPSRRRVVGVGDAATLQSTRFPLFGFGTLLSRKLVLGVAIGEYLDRTWSVRRADTLALRGTSVPVEDVSRSVGGVSDLRLAGAYRLSPRITLGAAVHALAGSTRLTVSRDFGPAEYQDFSAVAVTDFSGLGVSVGVLASVRANLGFAASLRAGTRLKASSSAGPRARVSLPLEFAAGARYAPVSGVRLAGTVTYAGWGRAADDLVAAGESRSRDVWSVGAGLDVERLDLGAVRLPLRLGYRWRQLPFPIGGVQLDEHAIAGGVGFTMAGGRTSVDLGLERGARTAGAQRETFTTGWLGVTVRP